MKEIPYVVYEEARTRYDKTVKRLIGALAVAVALIFLTNVIWLVCTVYGAQTGKETQYTQSEQLLDTLTAEGNINGQIKRLDDDD